MEFDAGRDDENQSHCDSLEYSSASLQIYEFLMIFLDRLLINLTGRDTNQCLGCDPDVLWDFETGNL